MTDESFLQRALEENSQSINAGALPTERCPACKSRDIGFNLDEQTRQRFYCRQCTTQWTPAIIASAIAPAERTRVTGEQSEVVSVNVDVDEHGKIVFGGTSDSARLAAEARSRDKAQEIVLATTGVAYCPYCETEFERQSDGSYLTFHDCKGDR